MGPRANRGTFGKIPSGFLKGHAGRSHIGVRFSRCTLSPGTTAFVTVFAHVFIQGLSCAVSIVCRDCSSL